MLFSQNVGLPVIFASASALNALYNDSTFENVFYSIGTGLAAGLFCVAMLNFANHLAVDPKLGQTLGTAFCLGSTTLFLGLTHLIYDSSPDESVSAKYINMILLTPLISTTFYAFGKLVGASLSNMIEA